MPSKKEKKRKITIKAKASAKNIVNINIGKGKSTPKRTAKVVKGISHSSPTIYSPAPTPFYVSAPQASPYSMFQETSADFRRNMATSRANSIQQEILPLPNSSVPSGSFVDTPATREFTNTDIPDSITRLTFVEERPAAAVKRVRKSQKQIAQDRARMLGISTAGTLTEINERIGAFTREEQIVGMAKEMIKGGGKDPFV
jgi:hypothetical protein